MILLFRIALVLVGLSAAMAALAPQAWTQSKPASRVALVIANSDYKYAVKLKNPSRDADAVTAALRGSGFKVTVLKNATNEQTNAAVKSFSRSSEGAEVVLVYFAGHGMQVSKRNQLLPVDADIKGSADFNFLFSDVDKFLIGMRSNGRALKLLIVDACRNNPFPRAHDLDSPPEVRGSFERGMSVTGNPGGGTNIIFSADEGQVAQDGTGELSPFARAFAEAISTPNLELQGVLKKLRQDVLKETGNQTPYVQGDAGIEFYFRGGPATPAAAPAAALQNLTQFKFCLKFTDLQLRDAGAEEMCRRAMSVDPSDAEIKGRYGVAQLYAPIESGQTRLARDSRARPALESAAKAADPLALAWYGVLLEEGRGGVKQDRDLAIRNYEASARQKHPAGLNHLGVAYRLGRGVKMDLAKAREYLSLAAAMDYGPAMRNLGDFYWLGLSGFPKDPARAVELYRAAERRGYIEARVMLARLLLDGFPPLTKDEAQARKYIEDADRLQNADGQYELGVLYNKGRAGLPKNREKALAQWRKAADQDHDKALFQIGSAYESGDGVPPDLAKAAEFYDRAARGENQTAMYQLAQMLFVGFPGLAPDPKKAEALLRRAASLGYKPAADDLANRGLK